MLTLREYQRPHAEKLLAVLAASRTAHDGSDCGTGKTYVSAHIVRALQLKALVICPKSVLPTWEAILADAGVEATVINWELAWRRLGKMVPWGKGSYFEFTDQWPLFIFDEVHRAQSSTTNQGKMLIAAARQGRLTQAKILTLSATAADSPLKMRALGFVLGLFELSGWFQWLDANGCPELTLGPKDRPEKQWKDRIFLKSRQAEVMQKLNQAIYPARGARLRIADIPDFPKTQVDVRLIDGHEREVQRLSRDLKDFYDNRTMRAALTEEDRVKLNYLRQAMEIAKVPAIMDMVTDGLETAKIVVFCNYSATLDALAEQCSTKNIPFRFIRGDQTPAERAAAIDLFQADKLDVILANIQAGGVGVSLHSLAKTPQISLVCPTFNAVDLRQALGRVHRDGGGPSIQHLIYFRGTIEERVASSVQAKLDRLDLLNDGELETGQAELALEAKRTEQKGLFA